MLNKSRLQPGGAQNLAWWADTIDWITDTARRPTRVLALGQETDFYGGQLFTRVIAIDAATRCLRDGA
jgi:hypothetical protein